MNILSTKKIWVMAVIVISFFLLSAFVLFSCGEIDRGTAPTTTTTILGWSQQPSFTNRRLYTVFFPSVSNGWVGGSNGVIFKTTDGGQNWDSVSIAGITSTDEVHKILFTSVSRGILFTSNPAVGDSKQIFLTENGGNSWQKISNSSLTTNPYFCIGGYEDQVWAGGNYRLYKYSGVVDWDSHTPTSAAYGDYNAIGFVDSMVLYVAGSAPGGSFSLGGLIARSSDGGDSWQSEILPDEVADLRNFFFSDIYCYGAKVVAIGYRNTSEANAQSLICMTDEASGHWYVHDLLETGAFHSLAFSDQSNGWIVGNLGDFFYSTEDGGANWAKTSFPFALSGALYSIQFPSSDIGWAVGESGMILKYVRPSQSLVGR